MWLKVVCLCLAISSCQALPVGYTDVVGNFSFNTLRERLLLTGKTGSIFSPGFDYNVYPSELTSGSKLINVSYDRPNVRGYRFTVIEFDIEEGDILHMGASTELDSANVFVRATRDTSLQIISGVLKLTQPGTNLTPPTGSFDLFNQSVFMDFYTTIKRNAANIPLNGTGRFHIEYVAEVDLCLSDYCKNGGTCTRVDFDVYTCSCTSAWLGPTCEEDFNECNISATNNCDGNANCTNTDGSFTCECKSGFTGNGTFCMDIDDCALVAEPCMNTGNCTDKFGGFDCLCFVGYENGTDGPCKDINECTAPSPPCHGNAICMNTNGSFTCKCNDGYSGDGVNCTDEDECAMGNDNCHDTLATCNNTDGSFTCKCNDGYTGNGVTCTDILECIMLTNPCDTNANCTDTPGSYMCTCNVGYTGNGTICQDINECKPTSPCANSTAFCTNNNGSFICTCNTGYSGNGFSCTDNDECAMGVDNCHDTLATCNDTDGSFTCKCNDGYTGNGVTCTDIDECTVGLHNCNLTTSTCMNTNGSFTCNCNDGFMKVGSICNDIDECTVGSHNCNLTTSMCMNTDGSFTCDCKDGFMKVGSICDDVDECLLNMDNCNKTISNCSNTEGSFNCICNAPEYRGTVPNCDYYCLRDQPSCVFDLNGFIDAPVFHDGIKLYEEQKETTWQLSGNWNGIKLYFREFNTEASEDFFFVSNVKNGIRIVAISGERENLHNFENPITTSAGIIGDSSSGVTAFYDNVDKTLTFNSSSIYIVFFADRKISRTGFKIQFQYDENDCPSTSPCQNGGTCEDRAFIYQCVNCPGFKGINCSVDINECIEGAFPCDTNADCENIDGSYNCTCKANFVGDGKTCRPHIVISGLVVQSAINSLTINFNVTPMWDRVEYVNGFMVTYGYRSFVNTLNFSTRPFTLSSLQPNTPYTVNITVIVGRLFGNSELVNQLATTDIWTSEAAASVPTNFVATGDGRKDRVILTWQKPEEIGFGVVTHYEIQYSVNGSSLQVANLRNLPTGVQSFFLNDDFTFVLLSKLSTYVTLYFRIRAFSSVGPSSFSPMVTKFMGEKCPQWKDDFSKRTFCNFKFNEGIFESTDFPQTGDPDAPFVDIEEYWTTRVTDFEGFRLTTLFFMLFANESYIDVGYGDVDITDHGTEKANTKYSFTNGVGPSLDITGVSTITDRVVFAAYISDQTRRDTGFQVEMQLVKSACASNPCMGISTAGSSDCELAVTDGFFCNCSLDYTGQLCEIPLVMPTCSVSTVNARSLTFSFSVQNEWFDDETVIGNYTFNISPADVPSITRSLGDSTVTFSGLSPCTDYTINMIVEGSIRKPSMLGTASCSAKTAEAAPSVPRNVTVVRSGLGSLKVTWQRPVFPNCMLSYDVAYTSVDHGTYSEVVDRKTFTGITLLEHTVSGLRNYRIYSIVVTARTSAGSKDADAVQMRTMAGPPLAFGGVTVTMVMPTMALLSWTYVSGAYPGPTTVGVVATSSLHKSIFQSAMDAMSLQLNQLEEDQAYTLDLTAFTGTMPNSTTSASFNTTMDVPGVVGSFFVLTNATTFIVVAWTPPVDLDQNGMITGYNITRTGPAVDVSVTFGRDARTYNATGLTAFTDYVFNIRVVNNIGAGATTPLSVRTNEAVPDPPTGIVFGTVTAKSIALSWTAPAPVGQLIYEITVEPGSLSTSTAVTFVEFKNLDPFTKYNITINARTGAGRSSPVLVTAQTDESSPTEVRNLAAVFNISAFSFVVTWDVPLTPNGIIRNYTITWVSTDGSISGSAVVSSPATTYTIMGLTLSSATYNITCIATTGGGSSNVVYIIKTAPNLIPPAPTGLSVVVTKTTAILTFVPPATNIPIAQYNVVYSQDPQEAVRFLDGDIHVNVMQTFTGGSPATITGFKSIRTYNLSIFSVSLAGRSDASADIRFKTLPEVPGEITNYIITSVGSVFTVVFNASLPFQGSANYVLSLSRSGTSIEQQSIPTTSQVHSLEVQFTGINGDTVYTIDFLANNSAGMSQSQATVTSAPVAPTVSIESNFPTSFTVTITPSTSVVTSYTIVYERAGVSSMTTISSAGTREITGLKSGSSYNFTVYAVSPNGEGIQYTTTVRTQSGIPVAPNVTIIRQSRTSLNVLIQGALPTSYVRNYTVEYVEASCTSNCIVSSVVVAASGNDLFTTDQFILVGGLAIWTNYSITVRATSDFGSTETAATQITRVGTVGLLNDNFTVAVDGATTTTSITVVNFCDQVASIFDESQGPVVEVLIVVSGTSPSFNVSITRFWSAVDLSNPDPYVTLSVCGVPTSRRRKRQIENGNFVIGSDTTCSTNQSAICNGQLQPDTDYTMRICGVNEDRNFACTTAGESVRTQPLSSSGLSAGEIAAIVICSILLVILIILLILYLYKRRRNKRGKHTVTRRGHPNEGYEGTKSQQKYQVDPAADPPTAYSTTPKPDA